MTRFVRAIAAVGIAALGLASASAYAWNHTFRVWTVEQMPILGYVADDGLQGDPELCDYSDGLEACCEETVPAGYCTEAAIIAYDDWSSVPCTQLEAEILDGRNDERFLAPNRGFDLGDSVNSITFNDPQNQITEIGTLAVTFSNRSNRPAFILNGQTYFEVVGSSDIVFNNDVVFTSQEQIDLGNCSGETNFQAVMTHEVGHFFGMAHTCEDGEACPNPDDRNAIMYWSSGSCADVSEIQSDDIAGITALYGPSAQFSCSHEAGEGQVVGVVPFELKCVINSDFISEITAASWVFGDGGTSTDLAASHTYTEAGNYTIQVDFEGENEACGDGGWNNSFRRVGYVRACDVPDAAFEVAKIEGLTYQLLNDSDVSVFGCISDIQWNIFKGEGTGGEPVGEPIKAWEPVIDFPEPGTYTAVMSLGGIAGTGGASATFEVTRGGGGNSVFSCSSTGTGGAATLVLLMSALLVRRRRD